MSLGFQRLFRRASAGIASTLYGAIVAQARQPALYADLGVPDTIEGRFEMVVLHTHLAVRRLMGDSATAELGQEVFDLFCADMDRSLREMGVGDLSVPKKMKGMAERYYGRAMAYEAGLVSGDQGGLAAAIERNVFKDASHPVEARALAAYAQSTVGVLAAIPLEALRLGEVSFPDVPLLADEEEKLA